MGSRSSSASSGGQAPEDGWPQRGSLVLRSEEEEDEEHVDLPQVRAYLPRRCQIWLQGGGTASVPRGIWETVTTPQWTRRRTPGMCRTTRSKPRSAWPTGCWAPGEPIAASPTSSTSFLPNQLVFTDSYSQKAFCGIYSRDGQLFMSACQDQTIRLYDCRYGGFRKFRSIRARDVGWSVLDVAFAPDGAHFFYSSWSDYIHICNIYGDGDVHTALDLRPDERRFAIFSLTVSSDGREVLGGASDGCVYVFDPEQKKRTLKIESHEDDVNAVAFADSSSHILFSGGDDALCKVWDRRTMRDDDPQPVGVLAGHRDGITFLHSKGDARYLISNSKDQTIKLWDIRRPSGREGLEASRQAVTQQNWDYRWQQVPRKAWRRTKLPGDSSLMTYRGHGVLQTLIRCRFSPPHSTGQRYIYSGCSTGKVVVYDLLSGQIIKKLTNRNACMRDSCVRDVSWHPYEEKIVSSSWDGCLRLWEYRQAECYEDELRDPENPPLAGSPPAGPPAPLDL